jgi:hypothetical protein
VYSCSKHVCPTQEYLQGEKNVNNYSSCAETLQGTESVKHAVVLYMPAGNRISSCNLSSTFHLSRIIYSIHFYICCFLYVIYISLCFTSHRAGLKVGPFICTRKISTYLRINGRLCTAAFKMLSSSKSDSSFF